MQAQCLVVTQISTPLLQAQCLVVTQISTLLLQAQCLVVTKISTQLLQVQCLVVTQISTPLLQAQCLVVTQIKTPLLQAQCLVMTQISTLWVRIKPVTLFCYHWPQLCHSGENKLWLSDILLWTLITEDRLQLVTLHTDALIEKWICLSLILNMLS